MKNTLDDDKVLKKLKFTSLRKFSNEVEEIVSKTKSNDYISVIVKTAEKYSIDLEEINKFISKQLLQKLEAQCVESRLLKGSFGFNTNHIV